MTDAATFLATSRKNGLLLDTNLLVLYLVGLTAEDLVERHKRTSHYTSADFRLLVRILDTQSKLLTTPQVLAEVSNLIRLPGKLGDRFLDLLARQVQLMEERYITGRAICASPIFRRLGIADTGIALLSDEGIATMTDDLNLYLCLTQLGAASINFNHLRMWS